MPDYGNVPEADVDALSNAVRIASTVIMSLPGLSPPGWREIAYEIILDGILVLNEKSLRERMTMSVFIETPDDIRLMRRVRRDCTERRVDLSETLRLYEDFVRPMHKRFVEPSSHHATWIWSQLGDKTFPNLLIKDLTRRLGEKVPA